MSSSTWWHSHNESSQTFPLFHFCALLYNSNWMTKIGSSWERGWLCYISYTLVAKSPACVVGLVKFLKPLQLVCMFLIRDSPQYCSHVGVQVLSNLATGGPLNKLTHLRTLAHKREYTQAHKKSLQSSKERKASWNSTLDYKMWLIPCPFHRNRRIHTLTYSYPRYQLTLKSLVIPGYMYRHCTWYH